MHRCLRIPELLSSIFNFVRTEGDPHDWQINQATLAALARTCRDFKEPALDALWHTMDSFLPLLQCLPGHALEFHVVRNEQSHVRTPYPKINVKPNLRNEDLSRLLYYAPRIRALHLDRAAYGAALPDPFVDDKAYERLLSTKSTPGPLLSNVKRLTLPLAHLIGGNSLPRVVIGRRLQQLSISGTCEHALEHADWVSFSTLLHDMDARHSLVDLSISLVDVHGYLTPFYTSCPNKLLTTLAGSRQLSRLNLESLRVNESGTVEMLGLIPNLRIITLNLDMEQLGPLEEPPAGHLGHFYSLTQLKLVVSSLNVVIDLVQQLKCSRLEVFHVERFDRRSFWDIREVCSTFAQCLPHSTLRSITLFNGIDPFLARPYTHNTSDLPFESLKQLFCFKKLEKFCVSLGSRHLLNDNNIVELGKAWPSLRHLELYEREFSESSKITPQGISSLSSLVPNLRHLTIRFNASNPSAFPDIPAIRSHRLRYLDVCTSDADGSAPIVPFIERLFPLLEYLRWGWVYEHPQVPGSGWETRLEDEEQQIRNDDSHECWISTFERLGLPRLKRNV